MRFGLFGRDENEERAAVRLGPALEAFDQRDGREDEEGLLSAAPEKGVERSGAARGEDPAEEALERRGAEH